MFHRVDDDDNFFVSCSSISSFCHVGLFIEAIENEEVRIERRLFASQEYSELLIAHVILTRKNSLGTKIFVRTQVNETVTSDDIDFIVETRNPQYV